MTVPTCQRPWQGRHLVVVADDFGRSSSVNDAVLAACDRGFLTAASMMAGGEAFDEAAQLAGSHPALSVGLHITLSDGCPVLPPVDIPGLVNDKGRFHKSPMRAGIAYWTQRRSLTGRIEAEVKAQFDKLERAGILPTHVDCHHHLHMHPILFDIIAREAAGRGVAWIRVPREPWSLVLGLHALSLNVKPFLMKLVFGLLARRNLLAARRFGLRVANNVYGLSGTGRMHEEYLLSLLPHVKGAISEIYLHPDLGSLEGREETKAVTSVEVLRTMEDLGLRLAGFAELPPSPDAGLVTGSVAYGHR